MAAAGLPSGVPGHGFCERTFTVQITLGLHVSVRVNVNGFEQLHHGILSIEQRRGPPAQPSLSETPM